MVTDPRPEFTEDSVLWKQLLRRTRVEDEIVEGPLNCLRCCGAKLVMDDGRLKFKPRFIDPCDDPDKGTAWENHDDWKDDCEDLLDPYKETIEGLLQDMEEALKPTENEEVKL